MLKYKGYIGHVEFDAENKTLHGRVVGIDDIITFESKSAEEIEQEFRTSVDVYLECCAERGKEPNKTYSGKFMVRIPPELHSKLNLCSILAQKSLNAWVKDELETAANRSLAQHETSGPHHLP